MAGGFSDARNERDRTDREKGSKAAGAATKGITGVTGAGDRYVDARDDPASPGRQPAKTENSGPGGGTTTTNQYSPGATGNFPDANLPAIADQMAQAIPGYSAMSTAYKGYKATTDEQVDFSKPMMGPIGDMFGGDPGKQKGWQPDRYKGKANMTGVGDPGSASGNSPEEREIAGRPYRAKAAEPTDAETGGPVPSTGPGDVYSDVMLTDRRKPYTSLKQMLETML